MFKRHTKCRCGCDGELIPVVDLGLQFPANNFVRADEAHQGAAPLTVLFCEQCTLAQLSVVYDPEILYSNYSYVTGSSPALQEHFKQLWSAIQQHSPAKTALEIGSNTGEFLLYCKYNGAEFVHGVEPAVNLWQISNQRGVGTIHGLWNFTTACNFDYPMRPTDVIVARHVFCHANKWRDFIESMEICTGPESVIVIEVPYVLDTLQRCELDQIYHEHLSYLSLKAMAALLKDTPFQMVDVKRFEIHGGTIAIFIKRKPCEVRPVVAEMLAAENITVQDWQKFNAIAKLRIDNLRMSIGCYVGSKKVVGFGASAKSSVWIQACGFDKNDIAFICDNTPQKQGRCSPGTEIPIVPESELTNDKADVAILFAWNWSSVIMAKHQQWIDGGGRFILPHDL